jgi:hypothetical protein
MRPIFLSVVEFAIRGSGLLVKATRAVKKMCHSTRRHRVLGAAMSQGDA